MARGAIDRSPIALEPLMKNKHRKNPYPGWPFSLAGFDPDRHDDVGLSLPELYELHRIYKLGGVYGIYEVPVGESLLEKGIIADVGGKYHMTPKGVWAWSQLSGDSGFLDYLEKMPAAYDDKDAAPLDPEEEEAVEILYTPEMEKVPLTVDRGQDMWDIYESWYEEEEEAGAEVGLNIYYHEDNFGNIRARGRLKSTGALLPGTGTGMYLSTDAMRSYFGGFEGDVDYHEYDSRDAFQRGQMEPSEQEIAAAKDRLRESKKTALQRRMEEFDAAEEADRSLSDDDYIALLPRKKVEDLPEGSVDTTIYRHIQVSVDPNEALAGMLRGGRGGDEIPWSLCDRFGVCFDIENEDTGGIEPVNCPYCLELFSEHG